VTQLSVEMGARHPPAAPIGICVVQRAARCLASSILGDESPLNGRAPCTPHRARNAEESGRDSALPLRSPCEVVASDCWHTALSPRFCRGGLSTRLKQPWSVPTPRTDVACRSPKAWQVGSRTSRVRRQGTDQAVSFVSWVRSCASALFEPAERRDCWARQVRSWVAVAY
jgi:hypothetical protein